MGNLICYRFSMGPKPRSFTHLRELNFTRGEVVKGRHSLMFYTYWYY